MAREPKSPTPLVKQLRNEISRLEWELKHSRDLRNKDFADLSAIVDVIWARLETRVDGLISDAMDRRDRQ